MLYEAYHALDPDIPIVLSVSGGKDSTVMALALWAFTLFSRNKYDVRLLYETTGFNKSKATTTINRLAKDTGWPLDIVKYQGTKSPIGILKESFHAIPKALAILEEDPDKSYKKVFDCCKFLKKKPADKYVAKLERGKVIIALGFKAGDKARHRKFRLWELGIWGTHNRIKANGHTYTYPLRDIDQKTIDHMLRCFGYEDVESSGCSLCPIFCIAKWHKKDPEVDVRSRQYARRLGIEFPDSEQLTLRESCTST